jgi:hypothetical protein
MKFGIDMTKLIITLSTFILTMHIIANLWAALATTKNEVNSWMKEA